MRAAASGLEGFTSIGAKPVGADLDLDLPSIAKGGQRLPPEGRPYATAVVNEQLLVPAKGRAEVGERGDKATALAPLKELGASQVCGNKLFRPLDTD